MPPTHNRLEITGKGGREFQIPNSSFLISNSIRWTGQPHVHASRLFALGDAAGDDVVAAVTVEID